MANSLPPCQLFGTLGCHLCEDAEQVLMPWVQQGLQVELIDIAEQTQWFETYALLIPVLRRLDNSAVLHWPFTSEQVGKLLS